jgi:hypothetical protein
MVTTIAVEGRLLGHKKPLLVERDLILPPEWEGSGRRVRLRELLTHVVLHEVAAFHERQEQRRLLHVLSSAEIEWGAGQGRVTMGGQDLGQAVDPQAAVERALQAFQDGLYLMFVDDQQYCDLDRELDLRPGSKLTFLRLVPLAGG